MATQTLFLFLPESKVNDWLMRLLESKHRLVAPVQEDDLVLFHEVSSPESIYLGFANTQWSPKEFLFPRTEALFYFRHIGNGNGSGSQIVDPELPDDEMILFGVRPCDAAGISVMDKVFLTDYEDALYRHRRERISVIAISCTADTIRDPLTMGLKCFCTAVGISPASQKGADILLTQVQEVQKVQQVQEGFVVETLTPKGEQLTRMAQELFSPASDEVIQRAEQVKERAAEAVRANEHARSSLEGVASVLESNFESAEWEEQVRRCLSCGLCAYVCPTCTCFDVVDEGNVWGGRRCRNWDSCGFALFTLHASGHNPRPTQVNRYRQRVMHKFCYFTHQFEQNMCVGCGRCLSLCPVGLNIAEVAKALGR